MAIAPLRPAVCSVRPAVKPDVSVLPSSGILSQAGSGGRSLGDLGQAEGKRARFGRVGGRGLPSTVASVGDQTSADAVAGDIEFLDAVRALPAAAQRKQQLPARLGVGPGDVVIEVGPGTGEDVQRFAAASNRGGLAVGVEISAAIASEAQRRARGAAASAAVFVVADARSLPFRTSAFSCGYCERVLQHVPGVHEAIAELHRVVVAGGRVIVFEPDQELRALDHPDVETERLLRRRVAPDVVNPAIGRQLFRLLTEAGFAVESIDGTAAAQLRPPPIERVTDAVERAIADGQLDRARADAYLATLEATADVVLSIWVAFEVIARKAR